MRINWISKAGVVALAVAGASFAGAQTNGPSGLSARVGVFFPTGRIARNLSATWFVGGADYKITRHSVDSPTTDTLAYLGVSVDYYGSGGASALPVVLNYNVRSSQLIWSAGLGIDFVRLGANTRGLAGQLGVTYEFGPSLTPTFVQAKYFISSSSALNGIGLFVGMRF